MKTDFGHLTYCTNIHPGESWEDHFAALRGNIPDIKKALSPDRPFGIGLRLSHEASEVLAEKEQLDIFRKWLDDAQCYVFILNGFPYGGFHRTRVKDQVHAPDWLTEERLAYTIRLFRILSALLPAGMEGGVSTSPLSYKHWHAADGAVTTKATENILRVVKALISIRQETGRLLHLDLEPEPDGVVGNGTEFLSWYRDHLLPQGIAYLKKELALDASAATAALCDHVQLCYDICHFAVGFEDHAAMINALQDSGIRVGRIQVSAALKGVIAAAPHDRARVMDAFRQFNESTYLHQVVSRQEDGTLKRYPDLPEALEDRHDPGAREWRSHFHVPLFVEDYGALQSTQSDITRVINIQKKERFAPFMEVETYTWEVLPAPLRVPMKESIIREMRWVAGLLSQ